MLEKLGKPRALLALAFVLALIKCVQFAVDSQALFVPDSGAFILNALRLNFVSFRSYVYGDMIGAFALPLHSLRAIVAMQVIMGGLSAWLLALTLVRFFAVRMWIAIVAALAFAFDPVQILYEHMVLTETAAMLALAIYLVTALEYMRTLSLRWLPILSLAGIVLVSLRTVYLPVVLAAAVLVPVLARISLPSKRFPLLTLALLVSCGSTMLFHIGYRHLTALRGQREPAYHYWTGPFLLAAVSPIVEPADSGDLRIAGAVAAQNVSRMPLTFRFRSSQLWQRDGLVARLGSLFGGNGRETDQAAQGLAHAAIRRNPLGYIGLGIETWFLYFAEVPHLLRNLPGELGMRPPHLVEAYDAQVIASSFGADVSNQGTWLTPSRRYLILAGYWYVFLLLSPYLAGAVLWLSPAKTKAVALVFLLSVLLLAAICFGAVDAPFRYLHPYSFTGLAIGALLCELAAQAVSNARAQAA